MAWSNKSRRRAQLPSNWASIRRERLEMDNWTCQLCGGKANEVDHTNGPLDHTPGALRSLCPPCHKQVTQGQARAARKKNAARRNPTRKHPGEL